MRVPFMLFAGLFIVACPATSQDSLLWKKVVCYDGKADIFPAAWKEKEIKARATAVDTTGFSEDSVFITKAFSKYPDDVIIKNVRNIYLLGKLKFYGEIFFGTNSRYDLYMALDNNDEIERTFHHEFSSILFRNNPSYKMKSEWERLSPELLSASSAKAMKAGYYSTEYDPALMEKGYLSPYALSNWENDFNLYAEELFCGGKTFWTLADKYPRLMQKARLIIQFYHEKIWGGFDETYFRYLAEAVSK